MKSAKSILREISDYVRPPHGTVLILIQWNEQDKPNWIPASSPLQGQASERYLEKIVALKTSDPNVDWSDVKFVDGSRRIVMRASDVDD
jgi:hypothetical protein